MVKCQAQDMQQRGGSEMINAKLSFQVIALSPLSPPLAPPLATQYRARCMLKYYFDFLMLGVDHALRSTGSQVGSQAGSQTGYQTGSQTRSRQALDRLSNTL